MIADSLTSKNAQSSQISVNVEQSTTTGHTQPAAKSKATEKAAGNGAAKKKRLGLHLWVGFLMAFTALAGYVVFGSAANATEDASLKMVNVSAVTTNNAAAAMYPPANVTADPAMIQPAGITAFDMAVLQAQMNDLTQRMNAISASNASGTAATNALPQPGVSQNPVQAAPGGMGHH